MSRERKKAKACVCARDDSFFFFVVVVVIVLIMSPVTLHCYYNELTLHVCVQFSNEENE